MLDLDVHAHDGGVAGIVGLVENASGTIPGADTEADISGALTALIGTEENTNTGSGTVNWRLQPCGQGRRLPGCGRDTGTGL